MRLRAVALLLFPGAVLSGRSAAVAWGVGLAEADDPVECTPDADRRAGAVRGVHVTRRRLPDEDVVRLGQFLRSRLVTLPELRAAAAATTGPGRRGIRWAAERAEGLAQSPQETRLRLLLHRSSLPRPGGP